VRGFGLFGELWLFRGMTVLAGAAMLLALVALALVFMNRSLQNQTDERQQFLQQTAQLNGVNETLVRLIARAAIDGKDQQLRDVLVSHGFRIENEAAPAPVSQAPAAEPRINPAPAVEPKK
jgi:hypothetical protein